MSKFSKSSAALTLSFHKNNPSWFILFPKWKRWTSWINLMQTSLSGSNWTSLWIQKTQLQFPSPPDTLLSSRMDAQSNRSSSSPTNLRFRSQCPKRTLLTRPGCFGLCWWVMPCLWRELETEDSELPDNELKGLALREVCIGWGYISKHATCLKKYDMRHSRGSYMRLNTSVKQFVKRLNELNCFLLYFLKEQLKQLDQD
jgi:hypothetical protein